MRVGHLDTESDALVAKFAFGHVAYLLAMRIAFQKSFDCYHTRNETGLQELFEKNTGKIPPKNREKKPV
jgi:hypothetical protein